MNNYLQPRLHTALNNLKKDIDLIASKNKDDEWKRDHYRYTFTVWVQWIYNILQTSLTEKNPGPVKNSTKKELKNLRDAIEQIINS